MVEELEFSGNYSYRNIKQRPNSSHMNICPLTKGLFTSAPITLSNKSSFQKRLHGMTKDERKHKEKAINRLRCDRIVEIISKGI